MKKLCLLFSLCPVFLWGQVEMDFENGLPATLDQYPAGRWGVSEVNPLEGSYSLRHTYDNAESSTDLIWFPLKEPDTDSAFSCSFIIRYEYNPSGSNNWCFVVLSEKAGANPLQAAGDKFLALGVNQLGTDDSLWIYMNSGYKTEKVLNCDIHCELDMGLVPWQFRVIILPGGTLIVEGGAYPGDMKVLAMLQDLNLEEWKANSGGLSYSYTSSKDRLLSIDNISYSYSVYTDSLAPSLLGGRMVSPLILEMEFDEALNIPEPGNFKVECNPGTDSAWIAGNRLFLRFSDTPVNDIEISIKIHGLADRYGNADSVSFIFHYYYPSWHDVVFSEVMADPSPPVYLPEVEFVEVFNRSGHSLNLQGWKLFTGSREWILPEFIVEPGDYHFFCYGDAYMNYSGIRRYTSVFSSASVLSNEGQVLSLKTGDNILIDAMEYSLSWYNGDFKSQGGWSLERTDMQNLCGGRELWKPSEDVAGGTPGEENSLQDEVIDSYPPFIQQVIYVSDSLYVLRFNESLDWHYFRQIRNDILTNNENIRELEFQGPFFTDCWLTIDKNEGANQFLFQGLWRDCSGNVSLVREQITCTPPARISACGVIITEVLFSPWPGCPEFVEIYNNSGKVLSLHDLKISVSAPNEPAAGGIHLSNEKVLFYPGTYLVLSRDPELLKVFYEVPERMNALKLTGFPSLSDAGARIALFNRGDSLIDEYIYGPGDHFPLLTDFHGVTIERMRLDRSPGIISEWHSASSVSGFATPGYQNSQYIQDSEGRDGISLEEKVFTPNNDGNNDLAIIHIRVDKEGYVAMIRVFDASGRMRKILGNNELLGLENTVTWDGLDQEGKICESGIYLIHAEAYHLSGSRKIFKEAVVLGRRR